MTINRAAFEEHLIWAEGEKFDMYKDSVGIWTIGVGHNIQEKGISKAVSRLMLSEDMQEAIDDCGRLDYFYTLDTVRQLCIADMVYNMGLPVFLTFKRMNAAMRIKDYNLAVAEGIDSRWYKQTGRRAVRILEALQTGEWNA